MDLLKKAILVLVWPVNIDGRPWRREPEAELLTGWFRVIR